MGRGDVYLTAAVPVTLSLCRFDRVLTGSISSVEAYSVSPAQLGLLGAPVSQSPK